MSQYNVIFDMLLSQINVKKPKKFMQKIEKMHFLPGRSRNFFADSKEPQKSFLKSKKLPVFIDLIAPPPFQWQLAFINENWQLL